MYKLDLKKGEEPEIKLPTIHWIIEKAREFQKTSTSASLTTLNPLTVCIRTNCGKLVKRWEYQITLLATEKLVNAGKEATVRTGLGTMDWFKIGKGVHQDCILSPYRLTYMQSLS